MPWSDPNTRSEYHKRYYRQNKQKWREYVARKTPEQKDKSKAYMIDYRFRMEYGITDKQRKEKIADQEGRCAICKTDKPGGKGNVLHVDHCHKSGSIRGMLCASCNMKLGWFEKYDNEILSYLKR